MVGVAGFEPATPCSQGRCANQAALHSDLFKKSYFLFLFMGSDRTIYAPNLTPIRNLVRQERLELSRQRQWILNPPRLPFRHCRKHGVGSWIRTNVDCSTDLQSAPFGLSGTPTILRKPATKRITR